MAMTILVVDDDRAVRESLARSLQYSGYGVETTEDGVEALAWLSGNHPDAVIMDVMMPRLDGLETTRMLRDNGNDVPILILTARDGVDDTVAGLEGGANDYMTKPFQFAELLARVRLRLREGGAAPADDSALTVGDLSLDAAQAAADWRAFLVARATELVPGGRLVVLTMALHPPLLAFLLVAQPWRLLRRRGERG